MTIKIHTLDIPWYSTCIQCTTTSILTLLPSPTPAADEEEGLIDTESVATGSASRLVLDFDSLVLVDADPHGASSEQQLHRCSLITL
jgi:hypothetical protein